MTNTAARRLIALGLDGFDPVMAEQLRQQGRLPNLARLQASSHRFDLETGLEKYTGLAWEQFSSGQAPQDSQRWAATSIDLQTYRPDQPTTRLRPFTEGLYEQTAAQTVVFDVPYFDLARAGSAVGMVSWGSHDPGVAQLATPAGLIEEIHQRFGRYPAAEYIYGFVWPDAERTAEMGRAMIAAVRRRTEIVRWLLAERLPEWALAITVISEYHSATEALWHGWDEEHPLHQHPSAETAREGLIGVYEASDQLLGVLLDAFGDCCLLAFTPHGMGRNFADVPAMLLLPELLYRRYTGCKGFEADPTWLPDGSVLPGSDLPDHWSNVVLPRLQLEQPWFDRLLRGPKRLHPGPLDWMPAALYRQAWPRMQAYASPAFYDGRVRVNLHGRESRGRVAVSRYEYVLDEIVELVSACRDPRSGEPLAVEFERRPGDPLERDATDADLIIRFSRDCYAFRHPRFGLIGPAPCRRPGGHSGGPGVAFYRDGSATGEHLGAFRGLELPAGVRALLGDPSATGDLADRLRILRA